MALLDELRRQYPEFNDYSDADLLAAAAPAFGGSIDEAAKYFGVKRNEPGFMTGLKGGLATFPQGAGRLIEDFGPEMTQGLGRGLRRYGEDVQFRNPTSVHSFEDFAASPWQGLKEFTGQAIGSTAPTLIPYLGPGGRAAGVVGGTVAAAVPAYGQIRDTQDQTGEANSGMALVGSLTTGAIEQLGGIQRMFRPAASGLRTTGLNLMEVARNPVKAGLRAAGEEGLEEIAQNPIQQFAGGQDPTAPAQLADTAFSGFAGFVGSLPFGGVAGFHQAGLNRQAQGFVRQNLGQGNMLQQLDAIDLETKFIAQNVDEGTAQQWRESQLSALQDQYYQGIATAAGASQPVDLIQVAGADNDQLFDQIINPYDVGGHVTAFNQGQETNPQEQQLGLFGGGGAPAQEMGAPLATSFQPIDPGTPMQALPHSGQVAPAGTDVENQVSRAAAIMSAVHSGAQVIDTDRQWAEQTLKQHLGDEGFNKFVGGFTQRAQGTKQARGEKKVPGQKPAAAPFVQMYKDSGGIYSPVQKAFEEVQTPEQALEIVRARLENKNTSQKVLRALEEMHKKLAGKTYTQHLREQERKDAEAVRSNAGQVRQGGAEGQPAVQRGADQGGQNLQRNAQTKRAEAQQQKGGVNEGVQEVRLPAPAGEVPTQEVAPTVDYKLEDIGAHEPHKAGMSYAAQMRAGKKPVTLYIDAEYDDNGATKAELDALVKEGIAVKQDFKLHGKYAATVYARKGFEQQGTALINASNRMSKEGETAEISDAIGAALGYTPEQRKSYINRTRRLHAGEWVQGWEHTPESPEWVRELDNGRVQRSNEVNPLKEKKRGNRKGPLQGAPTQDKGTGSGAQVPASATAEREGSKGANVSQSGNQEQVAPKDPTELRQWLLGQLVDRDPKKALGFAMHMGWHDGNAYNNAEIGERLGVSKERARQMVADSQGIVEGILRRYGIRPENFRETDPYAEAPAEPGDAPQEPRSSLATRAEDAAMAGIVDERADEESATRNTGFTTGDISKVNSPNITGEVNVGDDGRTSGFTPDQEGAANERAEAFEKAVEEGDVDGQAAEIWDSAAHHYSAQGEKMKSWDDLTKTAKGRETQDAWIEFYKQAQANENERKRDASLMRKIRQFLKSGGYYGYISYPQMQDQWGQFDAVDLRKNPYAMAAIAKRFHDGYGPLLQQRIAGYYVADGIPGDALVVHFKQDELDAPPNVRGKYLFVIKRSTWNVRDDRLAPYVERLFHHEFEHIVDQSAMRSVGVYSSSPALAPEGAVFQEVDSLWIVNRALFAYPMDTKKFPGVEEVQRKELYAQIMSAYHVPALREQLRRHFPLTFKFAEMQHEIIQRHLAEDSERAEGTAETAGTERGRNTFDSRNDGGADRTAFQAQGADGYAAALGRVETELKSRDSQRIARARTALLNLGRTPVVLRAVMENGAKPFRKSDVVVGTGATVYLKGMDLHQGALHLGGVPMDVIKRLPQLLADPVAIFKSSDKSDDPNSYKVVIDAEVNGRPVVVALKPNHPIREAKGEPAHFTATLMPHNKGWRALDEWAAAGLLRYYDDQRTSAAGPGNNPQSGTPRFNPSLAKNRDVATKSGILQTPKELYSKGLDEATQTPAFKRWFGDSKIVNADGTPKVMYHGTQRAKDIQQFKSDAQMRAENEGITNRLGNHGIYFTDNPSYANIYAGTSRDGEHAEPREGAVYPVYLKVERPYTIKRFSGWDKFFGRRGTSGTESMHVDAQTVDRLRAEGYDGIINERYDEVVVFDPTQVKSATGNRGTFDPGSPNINESRGLDEALANIPEAKTAAITTVSDAWAKYKPTLLTLHQLVDQFGEKLKSLKNYVTSTDKMEQRQQVLMSRAHSVITNWQGLHGNTRTVLNGVMRDATMQGIHPDKPLDDPANEHVTDKDAYNALKRRYDDLDPQAKDVYQSVRKLLDDNWKARKEAFAAAVNTAYNKLIADAEGDPQRQQKLEAERDREIAEHAKKVASIKGPYFPLLRFGDYLMIAESDEMLRAREQLETAQGKDATELRKRIERLKRDPKHYIVEAHENRYKAERAAARIGGMKTRVQLAEEHFKQLQPVTAGAVDRIGERLSASFDKTTAAKLKQIVAELYISSLPEHAALQRQLKRQGIEGATQDMLRAVAQTVEKDSFYLSRMQFADELTDHLFKLKQEAKKAGVDMQHVYNDVQARAALDFEYKPTPVQNFLTRMSAVWHLGMSPAYLFTNSTQPWLITAPVLAGKFGLGRSLGALRNAYVDAVKIIRQSKKDGAFADINFDAVTDVQERAALKQIMDRGQIDITQNVDMGLVADGADPRTLKAIKAFNWANHHIEATNRIVTGLAAYRLARQNGMAHEAAADYAFKQVVDTQLNYTDANAAYWMKRGAVPLGKLIFQFRKYQQGMIYLLARNAQLAFQGDKDALRALGYLGTMMMASAGAAGIPLVTSALWAFSQFSGGDDDEGDLETQLRNYLADTMGADAARAFWKGLPTMLGVDVSQRLGMGQIFSPLPFLRLSDKQTGQEATGQVLVNVLGAPMGMLAQGLDAAKFFGKGDWQKGIEKLAPKMLADVVKAERYSSEGVSTRAGTVTIKPERFDGWDIALRAAGFTPTIESEHFAAQQSKEDAAQAIQDRRSKLLANYANAKLSGQHVDELLEAIDNWNAKHPEKGHRIDRSAMLKAVQTRRKGEKDLDEAGVRFAKKDKALRGIDRYAYGA